MARSNGTLNTSKKDQGSNISARKTKNDSTKEYGTHDENSLEGLFEKNLKDVYSAEKQLVEALPEMAKAADNEDLQDAIYKHLQETKRQVERLEKIFDRLDIDKSEEETCAAMEGLIDEGNKIIEKFEKSPVRDSALIIGAQKIEHYEIASYGSLRELADVLGYVKIAEILDRTLEEEEETDKHLTSLAQDVNDEAYELSHEENMA
jgi:ferritin-like metal-binding protein YciE